MKEEYIKWYTKFLDRDFEMLVFGHSGYPLILFPTSHGRFYENRDFKLVDSVVQFVDSGKIKIYCPDTFNPQSWYNQSIHPADRVKSHIGYENVILNDIVPRAFKDTGRDKVAVAGCSFGGYNALNFAFRHPEITGYMFSLSGAFNIKQFLDGYYDDNCYFNNPPDYVPNLNDENILSKIRQIGIILGAGEIDACKDENFELSNILNSKGITHWMDFRMGEEHDWPSWRRWFPQYVDMMNV